METYINIACVVIMLITNTVIWWQYIKLAKRVESDYFIDYVNKDFIFRVFKTEWETQAMEGLGRHQVLDGGRLNESYRWILIEK